MSEKAKSPMERRARALAETALDVSGRHMTSQAPGLALLFVRFAENEIRLAQRREADPDQWLGPHLIKQLNPDCCCAVCETLREYCGEVDAANA